MKNKILNFLFYLFPIWIAIGIIPWSYFTTDPSLIWDLILFQFSGLVGLSISVWAMLKRK